MAECDICGQKANVSKSRIDGVLFNVCYACSAMGTPVQTPKTKKIVPMNMTSSSEEMIVPEYAELIKKARQAKSLKQEDVALKLNEKLSEISAIESGKRVPDLKLAKKLEKFFGIKLIEVS